MADGECLGDDTRGLYYESVCSLFGFLSSFPPQRLTISLFISVLSLHRDPPPFEILESSQSEILNSFRSEILSSPLKQPDTFANSEKIRCVTIRLKDRSTF